ncbi:hypothetical protein OQY15_01510 [Pedobacter sp. MC2016-15]|uniref:hypothetical protein n=1 Tax=Pedobacter sp. MC2016-15 TaxID=2994473 RepID=UPI00224811C1|nr:hypothetical protein [Pedobacter sp. MC2016-15]MCX2477746.1 hypothetical protein [Pedobacter sp. MC2016-15]
MTTRIALLFKTTVFAVILFSVTFVDAQVKRVQSSYLPEVSKSIDAQVQRGAQEVYLPEVSNNTLTSANISTQSRAGATSIIDRNYTLTHVATTPQSTSDSAAAASISREQNKLLNYLNDLGMSDQKHRTNKKFYYHMANVFARLKLYPLAMKCFFKAARVNDNDPDDNISNDSLYTIKYRALQVSSKDDAVVQSTALLLKTEAASKHRKRIKKSRPTTFPQIVSNFNDGKTAVAYALLFHVKQPAPGKPKIFVGVNTGHTFITLIKYNSDSTYASTSFGFYPDKDQVLSATPLAPTTSATFKDDTGHLWDEVLGKFISRRSFENILELTQKFEGMTYNLNKQNCTDFGLQAAHIVGIHINDTFGKWPGGRGNNPAITGQSILSGKISNDGSIKEGELFVDETVSTEPL